MEQNECQNAGIHIEDGHTMEEWAKVSDEGCWDFPENELFDGTIEPNPYIVYYRIDGRLYETNIEA